MAITFKDVARLAGVSTQTVSRVTNGSDNVAEKTREKVNKAINDLGYVPHKGAQMLSRARTKIIGIVSLDISLQGVALISGGIRYHAHKMGYATAFSVLSDASFEACRLAIRELIAQQVEAIIINAPMQQKMAENLVAQFCQQSLIFIDVPAGSAVNYICSDHQAGAAMAVAHLATQQHKNVFCITGPEASSASKIRYQEWQKQLALHAIHEAAFYEGNWQSESGYSGIKYALLKGIHFDAVLVANDQMALGVLAALFDAGIKVPEQVSVIGFDCIADSQYFCPPLTTIKQNFDLLSQTAVELALKQMGQKSEVAGKLLPVKLVVRQSSKSKTEQGYDKKEVLQYLEKIRSLLP